MSRDVLSCSHWPRPRNIPPPPAFGLIYEGRYWLATIVIPWFIYSGESALYAALNDLRNGFPMWVCVCTRNDVGAADH